jgi:chromosome transmission fidelity protein 4
MAADGSWLAIPGRSDVQLRLAKEGYKKERFLCSKVDDDAAGANSGGTIRGHSDVTVCLTPSPDGRYLLSSGRDGRVVVWEVADEEAEEAGGGFVGELPRTCTAATVEATSSTVVTSMTWSGTGTVRIARSDGSVTVVADVDGFIQSAKAEGAAAKSASEEEAATSQVDATVEAAADGGTKSRISRKSDSADIDASDDDVDFGGDEAAESSKKSNRFVDDEADEDDDGEDITKDDDVNSAAADKDQPPADDVGGAGGGLDDFVVDDDDAADGFPMADDDGDDGRDGDDLQPYSGRRAAAYDVPEMQPAFAPSSTPLSASTTRILCWNHVGTLTTRDDGPNNTVDINFVDGAFRRPVSFTDNLNFIVGSLGEDGGIFASDVADDDFDGADDMDDMVDGLNMSDATKRILKRSNRRKKKDGSDDAPKGSSIYFHRFETFGPIKDKDWVLTLPDGEMALGCACGEGWAAVATSRRFLRLYSSAGNQGPVTWLKGDLVTMVGRGRFLAVFYHENTPMPDGTQRIGYQLLDAASGNLVSTGSVSAISPGSTLTWAGFSNDYSLMVMDSDGMLSMLASETGINTTGGGWEWSPMLDTVGLRKSNDDSFWPVTCMDGKLVCVPLKGGNEHPDAVRRPVTTALGFRLPLARGALGKFSALEDIQVRADLSLKQKKFVNDSIAPDDEELMNEYDAMCAQVDKVTLKLLFDILKAGKVERALDLVERLHLEKSFEIAIKASDRLNFLKLSDRIEATRDARFPPEQFDDEEEEMDDGVDRRYFAQRPINTDRYEDDRDVDEESVQSSTAITPDVNRRGGVKRNREEFHSDIEEEEEEEEEQPEQRPAKRKINPFAKKKMESPGKGQLSSPLRSPSAKPKLSRNSTFSAQSRAKTKGQKRIL